MTTPPKIDNAHGLTWKSRKAGWEARWQARTDLIERGYRPKSLRIWTGPIIISEASGRPWHAVEFRRNWRLAAINAGIPKSVRNMDSRAGAITEALDAGALPDQVRKTATHSDLSMTQKYSRGDASAIVEVMQKRADYRKNKG